MTTLTGLQREAMRRAQAGEWELADAIEVLARTEETDRYGNSFSAGLRRVGRLHYLVYVDVERFDNTCVHCAGLGSVPEGDGGDDANVACEECDATGEFLHPFDEEGNLESITTVETLNGDLVYDSDRDDALPPGLEAQLDRCLTKHWAQGVVDAYHAGLAKPTQNDLNLPRAA